MGYWWLGHFQIEMEQEILEKGKIYVLFNLAIIILYIDTIMYASPV